ncbi:MAG: P-II family nitrogen regulator, partial [Nitrosopumilaceae archaeon]
MKKIEVIVKPEKVRVVRGALRKVGVTGVTVVSERGQGSGIRPMIRDSKGTPLH